MPPVFLCIWGLQSTVACLAGAGVPGVEFKAPVEADPIAGIATILAGLGASRPAAT
jgi:hypothetical protein